MTMDEEDLTIQNLYRANKEQQKRITEIEAGVLQVVADSNQAQIEAAQRIDELEAEKDLLRKDLIKYGAHLALCRGKEKCLCGFDWVKEQALKG